MKSKTEPQSLSDDEDLARRIRASLEELRVPSLRNVEVETRDGVIVLRGDVNTFYAKQLAQHSARRLAGDRRVFDEVSVVTPAAYRDPLRLRQAAAGAVLLLVALVAGCSQGEPTRRDVFPVTGQVTYQGRPAAGAWVVFHPKAADANYPQPKAQVDAQGNFVLSTYAPQDGAPAGDYAVTVELRKLVASGADVEAGPNLLPPQYATPQTTSIAAKVVEGVNTIPIKIVR